MGVSKAIPRVPNGVLGERPLFTGKARPHYLSTPDRTVFEASMDRVRWLFDEFDGQVSVSTSGGKDSTVVLELALAVAREKDCLPVKVVWLDQECEFQATADYQRSVADRPEVDFHWYQVPFRLFNSTNHDNPWLNVWGEGEEWVREKEEDSIHDHEFYVGTGKRRRKVDRFKELLTAINEEMGGAHLTGLRSEESPARRISLGTNPGYKWVTWSSGGRDKNHYLFHPVYDWTFRDVWKAIHDNGWAYNSHYDHQFQYGVPVRNMRVSNYHHETALESLQYLQEVEPETWDKATKRLAGLNTQSHIGKNLLPDSLPYMFSSWHEYLVHLIETLSADDDQKQTWYAMYSKVLVNTPKFWSEDMAKKVAKAVVNNDLYGTTIDMFLIDARRTLKIGRVSLDD